MLCWDIMLMKRSSLWEQPGELSCPTDAKKDSYWMSFWGATVITNLLSPFPSLIEWVSGGHYVYNPTLKRFFLFHFQLPFLNCGFRIIHLFYLHFLSSNNPLRNSINNKIPFFPSIFLKDFFGFILILCLYLLQTHFGISSFFYLFLNSRGLETHQVWACKEVNLSTSLCLSLILHYCNLKVHPIKRRMRYPGNASKPTISQTQILHFQKSLMIYKYEMVRDLKGKPVNGKKDIQERESAVYRPGHRLLLD